MAKAPSLRSRQQQLRGTKPDLRVTQQLRAQISRSALLPREKGTISLTSWIDLDETFLSNVFSVTNYIASKILTCFGLDIRTFVYIQDKLDKSVIICPNICF